MKRTKPKNRRFEWLFYDGSAEDNGRKTIILIVLTVLLVVSLVQVWTSETVKSVDKDGNFVTNVDGTGVYAFLLAHMNAVLLFAIAVIYFAGLGVSIVVIAIRLFQPNFLTVPFVIAVMLSVFFSWLVISNSVDAPDNELELFIEHQKIDESDVQSSYGDSGDLKTLSSALKSDADITVSDNESVELILVQGKDGSMAVYTVIGEAKNVDDFVLLGTVDDEDKLQVKSFFNSL